MDAMSEFRLGRCRRLEISRFEDKYYSDANGSSQPRRAMQKKEQAA